MFAMLKMVSDVFINIFFYAMYWTLSSIFFLCIDICYQLTKLPIKFNVFWKLNIGIVYQEYIIQLKQPYRLPMFLMAWSRFWAIYTFSGLKGLCLLFQNN